MSALLEIVDVVKTFPVAQGGGASRLSRFLGAAPSSLHAVDGVTFEIAEGEAVGLVGESGCGKSTLARLVARLLDATTGVIRFAGADIGVVPAEAFADSPLRAQIQMVFQDAGDSLNPRFTAFDAIADPLRRLGAARDRRSVGTQVALAADRVGLQPELLGRLPHQLSGGQRARVGIARGIALEPRLLVLDEPTSSLDVSIQALILNLLDRLRRELEMTYLFVSHDLNVVRLLCSRVIVMYLGQVVEAGPSEAVFQAPRHPYTQALVSAIPEIDPAARTMKIRLEGEPRSPIDIGHDFCRFAGRCPRTAERCTREAPPLRAIGPERLVACHFPVEELPA